MQTINVTSNVKLELTPQQLNIVLIHLKSGRYDQVCEVLNEIERQILSQVAQITKVETAKT